MAVKHLGGVSIIDSDIRIKVDLSRFEKQLAQAQYYLDSRVMADMEPYMPKRDGVFINATRGMSGAMAGTGQVVAGAPPFGRFLYYGKVMVDEKTRSPWARKDAKKIVTDKNLVFDTSKNPDATARWFEAAKKAHGDSWIKETKKRAGGG